MRFRAANSTILLVTGIAAFVQSAGSITESPAHAAVAAAGIALAVLAGWLQLPARPPTGPSDRAAGSGEESPGEAGRVGAGPARRSGDGAPGAVNPGRVGAVPVRRSGEGAPGAARVGAVPVRRGGVGAPGAARAGPAAGSGTAGPRSGEDGEPTLSGQIAVTALLALLCYFFVFVAGLVTVDYSAYLYESGVRPVTKQGPVAPGSPGSTWEWALAPGARSVSTFRRADDGSREPMLLLGDFFVTSCGVLDWTLATDGGRQLSHGTLEVRTRQRYEIPLPDRDRSSTLRLTLERTDTQECTARFGASPLRAAGTPRLPLPGLDTYVRSSL